MAGPVERHYTSAGLIAAIRRGLAAAGKDLDALVPADLAAVDEFHVRGRRATAELAERLGLGPGDRVLDVGSGLGGPSRLLAETYGCRVTGLDITAAYCEAATAIAGWVGLGDRVDYRRGDACELPFADAGFDAVWTQHASMNVADKPRMYAEVSRVLEPGGAFAIYDVLQGPGGEVVLPAPWARDRAISFLVTPAEMRTLLEAAGFAIESWRDTTRQGREWFGTVMERVAASGPPPLGLHILMGDDAAAIMANQLRNLEEDRVAMIEAVCRRP